MPIKPGTKHSYIPHTTGKYRTELSMKTLAGIRPDDCVGLRMPPGVLGIDVDAYHDAGAGFKKLVDRLGEPGPSYRSSSKTDDAVSGIRYYRIPLDLNVPGGYAPAHIDFITYSYRTAVVYPSLHKDTGQPYLWWDEQNNLCEIDEDGFDIPTVDSLHELSPSWVEFIRGLDVGDGAGSNHGDVMGIDYLSSPVEVPSSGNGGYNLDGSNNGHRLLVQSVSLDTYNEYLDYLATTEHRIPTDAKYVLALTNLRVMDEGRDAILRDAIVQGRWLELNGLVPDGYTVKEIITVLYENGWTKVHTAQRLDRYMRERRAWADKHFKGKQRPADSTAYVYNAMQMQHRLELVNASNLTPIEKRSYFGAAALAHRNGWYWVRMSTRALGEAVGRKRQSASNYMHNWHHAGMGLLKPGERGEGNTKVSNIFNFALEDLPTTPVENPTVNLDDYMELADQIESYWTKENHESVSTEPVPAPSRQRVRDVEPGGLPGVRTTVEIVRTNLRSGHESRDLDTRGEQVEPPEVKWDIDKCVPGRLWYPETLHNMNKSKHVTCDTKCPLC